MVVAAVLVGQPRPAAAWGTEVHQFIMDRAIALLPDGLRPFFEKRRAAMVERSVDPETWRAAGFTDEPPNHFVDIDWEGFGPYPCSGLPRDYNAAVAKFGKAKIAEMGRLPWRGEEFYGNLRRAFEAYGKRPDRVNASDVVLFAASMSHYVGDAHQPFHALFNYDGQLTHQRGLHDRFEFELFDRYESRLTLQPKAMAPVTNSRDFLFDTLIESARLAPPILEADLKALGSKDVYDDAYFDAFFLATKPVLERRISESIAATAAMITGAWEAAGKPAMPATPPPQPPKRKRP